MTNLPQSFPDTEVILSMPPAELAEVMIRDLAANETMWNNRYPKINVLARYDGHGGPLIGQALTEAWSWAEANGLLVHSIRGNSVGVFELSRAARKLIEENGFGDFRQAAALPRILLHPIIAEQAWPLFISGRFDVAVFAAFKALEVAVSEASGCSGTGTALMRAAFDKDNGPLTDHTLDKGERDAVGHLFAGAFGTFRNPVGHRDVSYASVAEPAEQLMIASHLMRIVDAARLR